MIKFLDELMFQLYSSSLSIMDILVITAIAGLANAFHWSIWILFVPWIMYSAHQKVKYDNDL